MPGRCKPNYYAILNTAARIQKEIGQKDKPIYKT
jgi:hypothetical protein